MQTFPPAPHASADSPEAPGSLVARFEHAASQVAFWQAMQRQIQKDKGHLRYVLPVGAVLAGALYFTMADPRIALGVGAVAVSAWLMGLYFTRMRQEEYSYNLRDAQEALQAARAALPASIDQEALSGQAATARQTSATTPPPERPIP